MTKSEFGPQFEYVLYETMGGLGILMGRTIVAVETDSPDWLKVTTTAGVEWFFAAGDCCSQSWIEHLTVPDGLPAVVTGVSVKDLSDRTISDRTINDPVHDCLQFYEESIQTPKGEIIVEFRNSSNGYYGGSLVHVVPRGKR